MLPTPPPKAAAGFIAGLFGGDGGGAERGSAAPAPAGFEDAGALGLLNRSPEGDGISNGGPPAAGEVGAVGTVVGGSFFGSGAVGMLGGAKGGEDGGESRSCRVGAGWAGAPPGGLEGKLGGAPAPSFFFSLSGEDGAGGISGDVAAGLEAGGELGAEEGADGAAFSGLAGGSKGFGSSFFAAAAPEGAELGGVSGEAKGGAEGADEGGEAGGVSAAAATTPELAGGAEGGPLGGPAGDALANGLAGGLGGAGLFIPSAFAFSFSRGGS